MSRAIPHFGQLPGSAITISGCIAQLYFWVVDSAELKTAANIVILKINRHLFIVAKKFWSVVQETLAHSET